MTKQIASIEEFHGLPLGTKLQVAWPGNDLDGEVVETDNTTDGYQPPNLIEVSRDGKTLILGADAFRECCVFTVL
jgi:hypothetical protein